MNKTISVSKSRMTYLPKGVVEVIGRKPRVIPNAYAVVMYNEKLELKDVKRSVEIILQDIEHRISVEERSCQ